MDFVVLKINGRDLSKASHEEAVEAFWTAEEPIIVEVLRKDPRPATIPQIIPPSKCSTRYCDCSTQTENEGGETSSVPVYSPERFLEDSGQSMFLNKEDVVDNNYDINLAAEQEADDDDDVGCDVEYEEITLRRNSSKEKLGLTLCCGSVEGGTENDIFVSQVEPESVAASDGRIVEGDQILQINGFDVHNRNQAVSLFSEDRTDFTILVARTRLQDDPDDEEGSDAGTAENASNQNEKDSGVGCTDESTKNDESSEHCSSLGGTLDSNRGTNAERNDQRSEKCSEVIYDSVQETIEAIDERIQIRDDPVNTRTNECHDSSLLQRGGLVPLCRFQSDASLDREMALLTKEMENVRFECESLINRHVQEQNSKQNSHVEHTYVNLADLRSCQSLQGERGWDKNDSVAQWVKSSVFESKNESNNVREDDDITYSGSNAYKSVVSSNAPFTLELSPVPGELDQQGNYRGSMMSLVANRTEDKSTQLCQSDVSSVVSCESCRQCCKNLMLCEQRSRRESSSSEGTKCGSSSGSKNSSKSKQDVSSGNHFRLVQCDNQEKNDNYVGFFPCTTMYTNQTNLQQTIWLQQQLFRQALAQQQQYTMKQRQVTQSKSMTFYNGQLNEHSMCNDNRISNFGNHPQCIVSRRSTLSTVKEEDEGVKMKWKVKKRADGTRYITRRPVRNRILKERAMKIMEERCGLTTDDDAMSELKTGKYWSKEERKCHLEKARDRKHKEMMMMKMKMAPTKERVDEKGNVIGRKEGPINLLELSAKKMKRKGKVFEDLTPVHESHSSYQANKNLTPDIKQSHVLSVTTV